MTQVVQTRPGRETLGRADASTRTRNSSRVVPGIVPLWPGASSGGGPENRDSRRGAGALQDDGAAKMKSVRATLVLAVALGVAGCETNGEGPTVLAPSTPSTTL